MKRPQAIDAATLEEAQTGRQLDDEAFEKARQERLTLELQSRGIARRFNDIADRHRDPRLKMTTGNATMIGLVSEDFEEIQEYKNCNMIPSVQARNTHDMMLAAQYYMDTARKGCTRMWVISSGWVPLTDYRAHHKALTRTISKLNASDLLKDNGVRFIYYSVENTIHRDIDGRAMLNLHAHVLVKTTRRLGEMWTPFIEQVKKQLPKPYLNDGPIKKAKEVVKYVFKPQEFDELTDDELSALYFATFRLRFHIPLDELRTFRAGLKEDGFRLKKVWLDDGPAWRLVKTRSRDTDKKDRPKLPDNEPIVIAITSPSPKFSGLYEPCIIVKNYCGNMQKLLAQNPWIEQRMEALRRTAKRRQDRPSIKDTTTITVQDYRTDDAPEWHPPDMTEQEFVIEKLDYSPPTQF